MFSDVGEAMVAELYQAPVFDVLLLLVPVLLIA